MISRTGVGIQIAGQDLRIAVVREFASKRRLLRFDTLAGFLGLAEEDRRRRLSTYFSRNRIPNSRVYLTLPNTLGVIRDLEFPVEVASKLRSAVALQVENLSPWAMEEIYWDCIYETPKKGARTIVGHVAIIPRAALDPWIALFRSAGLALMGASLSSLSWAHGASALWVASVQATMILGVEEEYVEGALVRNGRLHPITNSGNDPAALLQSSASQLLRTGRVDSTESVRVIVHGILNVETGVEPVPLPIEAASQSAGQSFGAIASALLGITPSGFRSNLIPVGERRRRNHLRLAPTYAFGVLLLALGLMSWMREPYQQLSYSARLDQEIHRLAPDVRSVADQEKQLNRLSDRLKALDGLLGGRDANLEALRELARVLPPATWLNSYQYQDGVISISGYSQSAAALQKLLEDSPVFRDAQFTSSITRDPSGKDRFVIKTTIEAAR